MIIRYEMPRNWIGYEPGAIMQDLIKAKAAMLALTQIPYQRSWADELQRIQLKREVAGTSRIEGAEFTDRELDEAMRETPEQLETRSQKQAACAVAAYRWIAQLPGDRPVDEELIREVHRRIVSGCDDDHCPPGQIRNRDGGSSTQSSNLNGITIAQLKGKTALDDRQLSNALYKLTKKGMIAAKSRGVYVKS